MKKVGFFVIGIVIVIVAAFLFVIANKTYYPALPIDHLSAKEVIKKLEESEDKVVEIVIEDNAIWYITRTENQGILKADENIKQLVSSNGWEF